MTIKKSLWETKFINQLENEKIFLKKIKNNFVKKMIMYIFLVFT